MIEEDDINTLIEIIRSEKDDYLKIYTLDLLKDHSQRELAIPTLIELLSGNNENIIVKAVEVLGKIKNAESLNGLKSALKSQYAKVRMAAIRALGEQDRIEVVEDISRLLFDHNWEVRNEAAIVLDYYRWQPPTVEERTAYLVAKERWEEILKEEEISFPILLAFLNDKEPEIRRSIIEIIGEKRIDIKETPKMLYEILINDENYDIREKAAVALCKVGSEKCYELLERAASSDFWFARKCVATAIRYIQDYKKGVKLLKNLVQDENLYVRKEAQESSKELLNRVKKEKNRNKI